MICFLCDEPGAVLLEWNPIQSGFFPGELRFVHPNGSMCHHNLLEHYNPMGKAPGFL